jgi:transposase-like protein
MAIGLRASDLFNGRHFDREIIVLCVRWYLSFKLSSRDLVQMMAERGVTLTHTTILRWVQRYVPEFEKRWNQYARPVGGSWRCDETYIKVRGRWTYLYRAVDKQGRTVDFLLSERRDVAAAKRFFRKAMENHATPRVITLDAYAASHRAISELKSAGQLPRRVPDTLQSIPEQCCRARPPPNQTEDTADARVQAIRDCRDND